MLFNGTRHKIVFENCISHGNPYEHDSSFIAAIYLLSADSRLWARVRHYIKHNKIEFEIIPVDGIEISEYILYKAAKELYLGTESFTISELSDGKVVSNRLFKFICEAIFIRRYGAGRQSDRHVVYDKFI